MAGDGGLDEAAEEMAEVADDEQGEAGGGDEDDPLGGVAVAAAPASRHSGYIGADADAAEDDAAEDGEGEDAEDEGGEAGVEPHVAVEDVAELVGDDALEFVAVEPVQGAFGDGDGGVGRGVAGGEGVYPRLSGQHIDGGDGQAGGEGHLLDDVEQGAFAKVGGVGLDRAAADHLGHGRTAGAELSPFVDGGDAADEEGEDGDAAEQVGLPADEGAADAETGEENRDPVERGDGAEQGEGEEDDQAPGATAGAVLGLEKVHRWRRVAGGGCMAGDDWVVGGALVCRSQWRTDILVRWLVGRELLSIRTDGQECPSSLALGHRRFTVPQNCTLGATRSAGVSTAKSSAAWKPKAPAKTTVGKVSRRVL